MTLDLLVAAGLVIVYVAGIYWLLTGDDEPAVVVNMFHKMAGLANSLQQNHFDFIVNSTVHNGKIILTFSARPKFGGTGNWVYVSFSDEKQMEAALDELMLSFKCRDN